MKSQLLTALIVVGVLGTASAAMAINTDTLSKIDSGAIGRATEVLVPVVSGGVTSTPSAPGTSTPTTSPSPQGSDVSGTSQPPAAGTSPSQTGSSLAPSTDESSQVEVKVPVPSVQVPSVQASIDGSLGVGGKESSQKPEAERDD